VVRLRYQRFSLYHRAADRYGLTLRPAASYRYVYPLSERDLADLVYYFEDSGDDDTRREFGAFHANRRPGVHAVIQGMDAWNDSWQGLTPPMLSMRDNGDEIVVKDTRNIAAEREHHVKGIAREILLAADRGTPEIHLGRQLKGANTIEIEEATADLIARNLIVRLDARLIGLATWSPYTPMPSLTAFPGGYLDRRG
ncbi:RiPP maturation radical SAM protein 1, partial [Rhizobium leguminosarum]